jgi:hypothetical protein
LLNIFYLDPIVAHQDPIIAYQDPIKAPEGVEYLSVRRPGGRVPDPNPNAAPGTTIPTLAFVFGAKSQKRLQVATDLIKYYDATGRDYTAANLQWTNMMKTFETQWRALKVKQNEDPPETPKILRPCLLDL